MLAFPASEETLEEFLKLHSGAHVALDLQLARHVSRRRVLLAAEDSLEVLLARGDRRVRFALALADADSAVLDRHQPHPCVFDVEDVAVVHTGELRRVSPRRQALEELACRLGHRAHPTTGRRCPAPAPGASVSAGAAASAR